MSKITDYFRHASSLLSTQYQQSTGLEHNLTAGECRELFVQEFLLDMYPEEYVLGDGEIIDSSGKVSPQADLVVYDPRAPLFSFGESSQYIAEGVLAHIEIKSDLTGQIPDCLNKTDEIKQLTKNFVLPNSEVERMLNFASILYDDISEIDDDKKREIIESATQRRTTDSIYSACLAFEGPSVDTFIDRFCTYYSNESHFSVSQGIIHPANIVNCICVLGEYILLNHVTYNETGKVESFEIQVFEAGKDSLMLFFNDISGSIYDGMDGKPDLTQYLHNEEIDVTPIKFQ